MTRQGAAGGVPAGSTPGEEPAETSAAPVVEPAPGPQVPAPEPSPAVEPVETRLSAGSTRAELASDEIASDEIVGWAGGVMAVLRRLTLLVEVNLLVALGTLAGGVVLGLGPALRAGSAVLLDPEHRDSPWRSFWHAWRAGWRRANLLFAPLWAVGLVLWLDVTVIAAAQGPARAAFQLGLALVGVWAAVVLAWWPRVALRYDDGAPAVWRFLLLAPVLGPPTALGVLVVLAATTAVVLGVPLAGLLAGVSFPLWATGKLVDDRLDRIDAR